MPLLYSVLTFFLTLGLLGLELFIPSGGLLGIAAAASLITSLILAFMHSLGAGAIMTMASAVGIPLFVALGLRIWPQTAIGRKMLNIDPSDQVDPLEQLRAEQRQWIGRTGIAVTDLLPSGIVEIDGIRRDAISNGVAIDQGESVVVCDYTAGRIQVRKSAAPANILNTPVAPADVRSSFPSLLETSIDELEAASDLPTTDSPKPNLPFPER